MLLASFLYAGACHCFMGFIVVEYITCGVCVV